MKIAGLDLSKNSSGVVVEELDSSFNIIDVKRYGFTSKRKVEQDGIKYWNAKDFKHDYDKYMFMISNILEWTKDCDYIFVEDYGYAAVGMVFDLAEFEGFIKISLFNAGKNLRFYSINSNKKFFTGNGQSDKISMYNAFLKYTEPKPDISTLPEVDNGHGVQTTSDIIDAYALAEFGRCELKLKNGLITVDKLGQKQRECFINVTKECPEGLIGKEFIHK